MTSISNQTSLNPSVSTPAVPTDFLVDRRTEAVGVAEPILRGESRLVVLHGAPDSGKTELVRRWIIPELRSRSAPSPRNVHYGECAPFLPKVFEATNRSFEDLMGEDGFLIIDNVERVLDLHREEQRAELDRFFPQLRNSATRAVVVLITESRHLTEMYSLASSEVGTPIAVCELPSISVSEALTKFRATDGRGGKVGYSSDVLRTVSEECTALAVQGWLDTFELAKLLHRHCIKFLQESGGDRVDGFQYSTTMGGTAGILGAHLQQQLELLDTGHPGDSDTARAILERLLDAEKQRSVPDVSAIATRIGVPKTEIERLLAAMGDVADLLRRRSAGVLRVVPPQLLSVIEKDLSGRKHQVERAHRSISDGLRSWRRLEIVLPRNRFDEVHAERRYLDLDSEQIHFLLRCALQHESANCPCAAMYWLLRSGDGEDGVNVLLSALFHKFEDVRMRSAELLADYPLPEVRDRLYTVALADDRAEVRAQAVRSLDGMKTEELREKLLKEVINPESTYREQAIDALRIFPTAQIAAVLKQQVNDPATSAPIRQSCIRILSSLGIPEGVDALLDLAFDDTDEEDRHGAARALATIESADLNRKILLRLSSNEHARIWVARLVLAFIALGVDTVVLSTFIRGVETDLFPDWFASLWLAGLLGLVPMLLLMRRLRDGRIAVKSFLGVTAIALFALESVTIITLIHGVGHLAIKMPRRATRIFGYQILGSVCAFVALMFENAPAGEVSFVIFVTVALILYLGTYLYDVVEALVITVVAPDAMVREQRRRAIHEQVFTNPIAAKLAFDSLRAEHYDTIPAAKSLLTRFGGQVAPAQLVALLKDRAPEYDRLVVKSLRDTKSGEAVDMLEGLWVTADPPLRRTIARILYKRPNERSLQALRKLRPEMDRWDRFSARRAQWLYPFIVLPRSLKVAAPSLVLIAIPFLYAGCKARNNFTWPQIVSLNQPFTTPTQKVATISHLGLAYPTEAGPDLFALLKENRDNFPDSVHAALTKAVAGMDSATVHVDGREWRDEVQSVVGKYAGLLRTGRDDGDFTLGLDVLKMMANAHDSLVADTASRSLASYIASTRARARRDPIPRQSAIAALGSVDYQRSLPLLDGLISSETDYAEGSGAPVRPPDLVGEIGRVARQAFANNLDPDSTAGRLNLLRTLAPLANGPKSTVDTLKQLVRRDSAYASYCKASLPCDPYDANPVLVGQALWVISQYPSYEYGYRNLQNSYTIRGHYRAAADVLERMKQANPDEVWPRKVLAEVFHEDLSLADTSYFQKSYKEMSELRNLKKYATLKQGVPDDYRRIEMDYIEVAFSGGHYTETDSLARIVLNESGDATERLNAALFSYFAYALSKDRPMAELRLAQLDTVVRSLPESFPNGWSYPGTMRFINVSNIPEALKQSLKDLVRRGEWYNRPEAAAIIERNRKALALLPQAQGL